MVKLTRIVVVLLAGWALGHAVTPMSAAPGQALPRAWTGTWTAPRYNVPVTSELGISVWGRNTFSVRDVDLSVEPDGNGTLKVFESVVDSRGKRRPFSTSVTEAHLTLSAEQNGGDTRPMVSVTSAETRYLDGTNDRVTVTGLKVSLSLVPGRNDAMNFRFDTAEGRGSFSDTLMRRPRTR